MNFSDPNPFDLKLLVSEGLGIEMDAIAFLLRQQTPDGRTLLGEPVVMKERDDSRERVQPSFYLSHAAAQQLMDALYAAGIRPRQAKDNASTVAAMGRHLEDMRSIAFAKTGVTKP